jgi:ribosomal protein L15
MGYGIDGHGLDRQWLDRIQRHRQQRLQPRLRRHRQRHERLRRQHDRGGTNTGGSTGTGSDAGLCPHCGQSVKGGGGGLEQFLGRLGITEEMINNLKTQFQNVEIDEYLNTARDYLKDSSGKASTYAKENPGKVAAGVAALALGAGLLYAANRDKT